MHLNLGTALVIFNTKLFIIIIMSRALELQPLRGWSSVQLPPPLALVLHWPSHLARLSDVAKMLFKKYVNNCFISVSDPETEGEINKQ